ncbi:uncharacterized protein N7479_007769 [Penicillium vulpinum]|uniref:uncharacterized protein n=1 Tax=Penicillium vulpinum TaxID=29845 RepID=UPI0025495C86|nr:uncharacterized protein N7479_007769 [Penicillium vulpinum]KAJ5960619.1 hypothetical protein N7479_007769 [Penicillium vulpinum]
MANNHDLASCVPLFASQDWLEALFESNGRYYTWARDDHTLLRIFRNDLEEIKQIITDWGQGALHLEYMGPV